MSRNTLSSLCKFKVPTGMPRSRSSSSNSKSAKSSDDDHAETRERRNNHNDSNEAARISVSIILGLAQAFLASSNMRLSDETEPLIRRRGDPPSGEELSEETPCEAHLKTRGAVWGGLTFVFVAALVLVLFFQHLLPGAFYPWLGLLPKDPSLAALRILDNAPIIVRL